MQPDLTIIVPVRAGLPCDTAGSLSLACQDFAFVEIIVVNGNAVSKQRNEAARLAKSEFLYFIDDDSHVDVEAIREGIQLIKQNDIDVVGGPSVTRSNAEFLESCFGEVVAVPFGAWHLLARVRPVGGKRQVDGDELISCNLMIRKQIYQQACGMNEQLYPGEDTDFIRRLKGLGANLYYNPDMIIRRPRRQSLQAFASQYYKYGIGKGKKVFSNFSCNDLVYLIPSLFVVYLFSLLFAASSILWFLPLLVYAMLSMSSGVSIALRTGSIETGLVSSMLFLPLHASYGSGVAVGICKYLFSRVKPKRSILNVTVIELAHGEQRHTVSSVAIV